MDELYGQAPTTELDAVNVLLAAAAESPVDTLDEQTIMAEGQALRLLRRESRAFQSKGWTFNTDLAMKVTPAVDGTIALPRNCLGFQPVGNDKGRPLVYRAGKVYDRYNNTFTLSRPVWGDVISCLDFEDMPEAARYFVTIRCARMFQDTQLGDSALHQFEEKDELEAWAGFLTRDTEDAGYNVNRDSPTVSRVTISRHRYYR